MKAVTMHHAWFHVLGRRYGMYLLYTDAGDLHLFEVQGGAHPLPDERL